MVNLKAPFPWFGDAMAYAVAHVAGGVLRFDNDGRIWRCAVRQGYTWKEIEPRRAENPGGKGYLRVSLAIPGERRLAVVMAHCLVYVCKVGQIPKGLQFDHKNTIKTDNRPTNLEPVTGAINIQRSYSHGRTKPWSLTSERRGDWRGKPMLTASQKTDARKMRASGMLLKDIALHFNIATSHAHRITSEAT